MRTREVVMGVLTAPLAMSRAFVPAHTVVRQPWRNIRGIAAASIKAQSPTATAAIVARPSRSSMASAAGSFSMSAEVAGEPGGAKGTRVDFLRRLSVSAVGVGVSAAGLATGSHPALADSTGKYSSKATAKKRYIPRIAKAVKGFEQLRKDIDDGSASASSPFFVEVLPDAVPAMDLFGSSMKRGETPDSKSRKLQQMAQDFGNACTGIGKGLGKKGTDSVKAYNAAAVILEQYLKGTELEPIGSPYYDSLE